MATSAFKSTSKRTPIGKAPPKSDDSDSSINRAHRRSRSLSRFSRRPPVDSSDGPAPRGRFVNTVRGSGFPEISLDDLAIEFFSLDGETESDGRGRSSRRFSEISPGSVSTERRGRSVSKQRAQGSATSATVSSERRGRSVSRQRSQVVDGRSSLVNCSGTGRASVDSTNSRRRRSVSAVRCRITDPESDVENIQNSSNHATMKSSGRRNSQTPSLQKPKSSGSRRLVRSLSQKDLSKSHDGYSSQSSALTDDDAKNSCSGKNVTEKTIRAVYAQKKAEHPVGEDTNSGLYNAMRKELRSAVDEIRMELENAALRKTSSVANGACLLSDESNVNLAVPAIEKNRSSKVAQCVKDFSKVSKEPLADRPRSTIEERPLRSRKRSNDRSRMSKRLTEEAEKYLEDFISNVEDTDLSSFDGERSDTSSTLGITRSRAAAVTFRSPEECHSRPVEMDGVILPWLQWETKNDGSSLPLKTTREVHETPKSLLWDSAEDAMSQQGSSVQSTTSNSQSWSATSIVGESIRSVVKEVGVVVVSHKRPEIDMDRYLDLKREDDLLSQRWSEQHRISSGGLLLCNHAAFI